MRRALLLCLLACDSTPNGMLSLDTCGATGVFSDPPAPTKLQVDALDSSGNTRTLVQTALPASSVDLGNQTQTDIVSLRVSGLDDNGAKLVYGASLFLTLGSLQDANFPIFVQRTGQWAEMCGTMPDAREAPIALILNRRSIVVGGGGSATLAGYDFATLSALDTAPTIPAGVGNLGSMAIGNNEVALIGDQGTAEYSLQDACASTLCSPLLVPSGMSAFAEVLGGATVVGDDGTSYIVGATRPTGPTSTVYTLDPSNNSTAAHLLTARAGAAAAFVPGRGIVVFGGGGPVEVLAAQSTTASALPFAADPTTGAGAALAGSLLVVAGGVDATGQSAPPRTLDLNCTSSCAPVPWAAPTPKLTPSQVFGFDDGTAILIGDDDGGNSRAFKLTATAATELTLKVPRKHGRAVIAPTGAIVIVGGAGALESFFP